MSGDLWLCIDQGGQSTRAALFDERGDAVALGQAPLETLRLGDGRVEHDPAALLESVRAALAGAFRALDGRPGRVRAAGLATQRSTLVCARRSSAEALSPAISWQDRRGAAELEAAAGHRRERIRELTGLRLTPHYGAGKIAWCVRRVEPVAAAARQGELVAAPLASFLLRRLGVGGGWQVDPANASRMLLMDVRALAWSPELLDFFGVDTGALPEIRPSRSAWGDLSVDGRNIPVRVVTGDQSAALFCSGTPGAGTVFVNIGTGAFLQCSTAATPVFDDALLTSVAWQDDAARTFVLEGTVNGAASAVEAALAALDVPRPSPHELEAALAGIARAPLYLNGISGLGSPDWVADFPSRFVGAPEAGPLERLAAVYESVLFLIVRNLDRMRRLVPLERIVVTGGLSRLDFIPQELASLAQLPVERPERHEATLEGLHFLVRRDEIRSGTPAGAGARFLPRHGSASVRRYRAWTAEVDAALERL